MKNINLLFFGDYFIKNDIQDVISKQLRQMISDHDIVCCNYEGPVSVTDRHKIQKVGTYLKQNRNGLKMLSTAGFNLLNLANNHVADYGKQGLKHTVDLIKKFNIEKVGADSDPQKIYEPTILNINKCKIGFLSFCEAEFGYSRLGSGEPGFAWVNDPHVDTLISKTREKVDFLVIQVHAGIEEIDVPLPEWKDRYKQLIDSGGDIVICHHPHVPQGWEKYKNKYIFYSLGNFVFEANDNSTETNGYCVSVNIKSTGNYMASIFPLRQKEGKVYYLPEKTKMYDELCDIVSSSNYIDRINKIAVSLWRKRYMFYYMNSVPTKENIFQRIRKYIDRYSVPKNTANYTLLLHNIRIESHRWIVERALSVLAKNENTNN